jgi:hypothetical membrane protein
VFFNSGCILTGLALFPFFAGMYKWYTNERWRKSLLRVTQLVGFVAAFALVMIGVFPEDRIVQHLFWAEVFFAFNLIMLILANVSLMNHRGFKKPVGYYGFAVALINVLFVVFRNTPVLEWFTVFTALGFVALLSYNTYKLPR